jgi:hypothetical protein
MENKASVEDKPGNTAIKAYQDKQQRRGVHVTGVSAAYTFKLNKNILSE